MLALASRGAVRRAYRGGQRFESLQLHQEVGENSGGFRTSEISRGYRGLARLARVCAGPSAQASRLTRPNATRSLYGAKNRFPNGSPGAPVAEFRSEG